jgi:PBP1b-binding outer membrane lipoprotein LpoB
MVALAGCTKDYGTQRPDVSQLDKRDSGLQSKDVVQASDDMAMKLLSDPTLNASKERWAIVVDRVENRTVNSRFDLDVFLQRLKAKLAQQGHGRVQLIENKDKLHEMQSRELEEGSSAAGAKGIQPDYALYCRIEELPNRGTSYYQMTFTLTDLHTRELAWTDMYEVRVEN